MSMIMRKTLVDPNTGEVLEGYVIIPEMRDNGFVKVFRAFTEKLLQDLRSMNSELKILNWMLAKTMELPIQSEMWVPVLYEDVAEETGLKLRTVKRGFASLRNKGYLEQFAPRRPVYRIRPSYLYKGNLSVRPLKE